MKMPKRTYLEVSGGIDIPALKELLKKEPLDRTFERYGNFVMSTDAPAYRGRGYTMIWGNFKNVSAVFDIVTNSKKIIKELTALIRKNQQREDYGDRGFPRTTVILRRQGCSNTLNSHATDNNGFPLFYIEFQEMPGEIGEYRFDISYPETDFYREHGKNGQFAHVDHERAFFPEAKKAAMKKLKELFGLDITFAHYIQAYGYSSDHDKEIWPNIKNDVYLSHLYYDVENDRIAEVVTDKTVFAFTGPTQGTAIRHADIMNKAYSEFLKPHNQRGKEIDNKGWLTWLAAEYIKKENVIDWEPTILNDIVKRKQ